VADWLNSAWPAALGYGLVAVLAAVIGWRQSHGSAGASGGRQWPAFWFTTAVLAVAMGLGRALGAGGVVSDLGRLRARSGGWYEDRRVLQVVVIVLFVLALASVVAIAVRRWGPRLRAGYLHVGLLMAALVCYSVVRIVSLHQIDARLRGNDVAGVMLVTLVELVLLTAVAAALVRWLVEETRYGSPPAAHGSGPARSVEPAES
jgi:hypothetical protein